MHHIFLQSNVTVIKQSASFSMTACCDLHAIFTAMYHFCTVSCLNLLFSGLLRFESSLEMLTSRHSGVLVH